MQVYDKQDVNGTVENVINNIYIPVANVDKETVLFIGDVIWITALTFYIYAEKYKINGVLREGLKSDILTSEVADVAFSRDDTFIIENDGLGDTMANDTIKILKGVATSEPVERVLSYETQLRISAARIGAGALVPTTNVALSEEVVYKENVEWAITGGHASINPANGVLPISETKDILCTNVPHNTQLYFKTLTSQFTDSKTVLEIDLKLLSSWIPQNNNGTTIDVYLWKGNNRFTNRLRIGSDKGLSFDGYNLAKQTVYLRLERFSGIFNQNTFDGIEFQFVRCNTKIFHIDNIRLVSGYGGVSQNNPTLVNKTSDIPLNDGSNGVSRYAELTDLINLNASIQNQYDTLNQMLADYVNQTVDLYQYVTEEFKYYIYNGYVDGTINDYTVYTVEQFTAYLQTLVGLPTVDLSGYQRKLIAGQNITINVTDPLNPVINAIGSTYPPPFIDLVVPDSTLPSTTGNFELYGSNFKEDMTVSFAGQTVNYKVYHSSLHITVNITTGPTEGLFSITLNNGISRTFTNAYMVVLGLVFSPLTADWVNVNAYMDVVNDEAMIKLYNQLGTATWNREFNYLIDWSFRCRTKKSPLGTANYTASSVDNPKLVKVSNNQVVAYINRQEATSSRLYIVGDLSAYCGLESVLEIRYIGGVMRVYSDNVLKFSSIIPLTENLKLIVDNKTYDLIDIKYIELAI